MPAYTRGIKRDILTFVPVTDYLYYGWKTKEFSSVAGVTASDISELGHLTTTPSDNKPIIFAATSPRPPRVTKKVSDADDPAVQASVSTYCDPKKLVDAQKKGWSVSHWGRSLAFNTTGRTVSAACPIADGTALYVFPMNATDFGSHGATLGLKGAATLSQSERETSFSGASRPRPARVRLTTAGQSGGRASTISSFVDSQKLDDVLRAGWVITEPERVTV